MIGPHSTRDRHLRQHPTTCAAGIGDPHLIAPRVDRRGRPRGDRSRRRKPGRGFSRAPPPDKRDRGAGGRRDHRCRAARQHVPKQYVNPDGRVIRRIPTTGPRPTSTSSSSSPHRHGGRSGRGLPRGAHPAIGDSPVHLRQRRQQLAVLRRSPCSHAPPGTRGWAPPTSATQCTTRCAPPCPTISVAAHDPARERPAERPRSRSAWAGSSSPRPPKAWSTRGRTAAGCAGSP